MKGSRFTSMHNQDNDYTDSGVHPNIVKRIHLQLAAYQEDDSNSAWVSPQYPFGEQFARCLKLYVRILSNTRRIFGTLSVRCLSGEQEPTSQSSKSNCMPCQCLRVVVPPVCVRLLFSVQRSVSCTANTRGNLFGCVVKLREYTLCTRVEVLHLRLMPYLGCAYSGPDPYCQTHADCDSQLLSPSTF